MVSDCSFCLSISSIDNKSDIGNYTYHPTKKNAVVLVDNSQNLIHSATQDIEYDELHNPLSIVENGNEWYFEYDVNHHRNRAQIISSGGSTITRVYVGNSEYQYDQSGDLMYSVDYVAGGDGLCALVVRDYTPSAATTEPQVFTVYKDYLGSINVLVDENGTVAAEQEFDPWGRYRDASTCTASTTLPALPNWLWRGYTGHEHIEEFQLINMNGRLYDPYLGRMLSPDNFVQDAVSTQNYNRYSYALNNPLKYTDPNGEFIVPALVIGALLLTDVGYDVQKAVSPVAVHVDLNFGSHANGIGLDVSVGVPQIAPINYRYDVGATYFFNRPGGYGSGWQVRNGGEWGVGLPGFQVQYGGMRYRDFGSNGDLLADQVVHTAQIGNPLVNVAYSNDTEGSFPWADNIPLIPKLRDGQIPGFSSDRYRTASGRARFGLFELGFFLHTGEGTKITTRNGQRFFDGGNINDPDRSNGIAYFGFGGLKIGWDSEDNRQFLQNRVAHDGLSRQPQNGFRYPWILTVDRSSRFVFQFGGF